MMLRVNVALLSGRTEVLEVEQSSSVQELKVLAQNSLQRRLPEDRHCRGSSFGGSWCVFGS